MVTVKEFGNFKDYGNCVEISNGVISALVTVEIGPRIISFGFKDSQNFMNSDRVGLGGKEVLQSYVDLFGEGRQWENLGGHRIWLSPESYPETYTPDDKPCTWEATENGAVFTYSDDVEIGAKKTMEIKMDDAENMQVIMSIKNITDADMEFAIWALSVCSKNGTLIIPMNTNDTDLLPNRTISVWPYTDMSSPLFYWGRKYITVKQEPTDEPYKAKIGLDLNSGTAYYVLGDEVLKKTYETNHPAGKYPDGGCSFETYVCDRMIEFETLGELKNVAPGESSVHIENWTMAKKPCDVDFKNDDSIDAFLERL